MKNRYTKRHYEDVAEILRERRTKEKSSAEPGRSIALYLLDIIAEDFAVMFKRDHPLRLTPGGREENPYHFDRERFLAAYRGDISHE